MKLNINPRTALSFLALGLALAIAPAANAYKVWDLAGQNDQAKDLAQDDAGVYVYVVGTAQAVAGNNDIYLDKRNSSNGKSVGAPFPIPWSGSKVSDDQGIAVDVDSAGNVWVAGTSNYMGTGKDIIALKYDSKGTLLGQYRFNGTANQDDIPVDIGCAEFSSASANEEAYIIGNTQSAFTAEDIVAIGLQNTPMAMTLLDLFPGGPTVWNGVGGNDHAYAMAGPRQCTDGYGGAIAASRTNPLLVAAGKTWNGANYDLLTKDFDPVSGAFVTGTPYEYWHQNGSGNGDDWLMDVDADDNGVCFTGSVKTDGNAYEIVTVTFLVGAAPYYREEHRFAGNLNDYGIDVECRNQNLIDVAGDVPQTNVVGAARTDIAVHGYNYVLGAPVWSQWRNINYYDHVDRMSMTNNGTVGVAASFRLMGGNTSCSTMAFTAAGALSWGPDNYDRAGFYDEPAMIRASRTYLNFYVAGTTASSATSVGNDWFITKYLVAAPVTIVW